MKHFYFKQFLITLLLLCGTVAHAFDFIVDGVYYNIISETAKTVKVTRGSYSDEVIIPNSVNYNGNFYSVKSIGYEAFRGCSGLTSVTIPNSVTSIGERAFYNCDGLTNVTIPNNVISIGNEAFYGCDRLTNVTIGNSVTSIGADAFGNCFNLNSVHISNLTAWCRIDFSDSDSSNPLYYAKNLYLNGELITDLVIPNDVTEIKQYAFYFYKPLTSVTIHKNVTNIGQNAFMGCENITAVHISDLSAWCKIDFSNSYSNPLSHAKKLYLNGELVTDLVIPNDITEIKQYAFYGCESITSVTIHKNVTSIGQDAFSGCEKLFSLNISDLSAWCKIDFSDSRSNPLNGLGFSDNHDQKLYLNGELVTDLVIPNDITEIKKYTFFNFRSLTSVTIHENVTSIGAGAFGECWNLTAVHISDLSAWCRIDFDSNDSEFSSYPNPLYYAKKIYLNGELVTDLVIPNDVTEIKQNAFYGCTKLTSVTIGNGVTSIGDEVFSRCSGLTSVTIGNSVTSIGERAFSGCENLKVVYNNSALNIIKGSGEHGFVAYYANAVITEENANEYEFTEDFLFHVTDTLNTLVCYMGNEKEVTLPENCNGENYAIGDSVFYRKKIKSVTIPNSVTSIGEAAFYECNNFTSITIGNGVTSIGDNAFYDSYIDSVHISDLSAWCNIDFSDKSSNPLYYARNLYLNGELVTDLVIPNDITEIKQYAFYYCFGLTNVTIPNSVTSIGDYAFYACTGLTRITIGNSVTSIGDEAFCYCKNLTSISIPNSVTSIKGGAFADCDNLTAVHISDLSAWCKIDFEGYYATFCYSNPLCYAKNLYLNGVLVTELVIPNDVTEIKQYAFYKCESLTNVTIDNNVTSIGMSAFYNCKSLTSVTIGNSVTTIGGSAFSGCESLTSVTIGNSVTTIKGSAFNGCDNINEIYSLSEVPATIYYYAFSNYNATLYVPIGAKEAYQAAEYWKNFTNIVEMDMTGIEDIVPDESYRGLPDTYYDMQGRIVEEPTHGIYIYNGIKVLVK